jgi:hypothetical protein
VLLRQVELALLLKTRASVVLTQDLEFGPVLGELLRDAALRRNGAGPTSGLLVLRAGRRRMGNLTPLESLVEAVELRKDEFAVAIVLGACGLRLRVARGSKGLPTFPIDLSPPENGCRRPLSFVCGLLKELRHWPPFEILLSRLNFLGAGFEKYTIQVNWTS